MATKKNAALRYARLGVQVLFFGLIAAIAVNHTLVATGGGIPFLSDASTHAVCPFGGVVSVWQTIDQGTMVKKLHESNYVLMWIGFGLALLAGPVFCGWICPFGSIQEWIGKLGRRLLGKRYNALVPKAVDRVLRYLRYVVMAVVVWDTARLGVLVFEDWDPYYALFNFWGGEVAVQALVALGLVVVLSLFVERPFCKYACPYGALLGAFNWIRVFKIRRNVPTCIDCKACDRACPMNIEVSKSGVVRDHQCISCLECTSERACPVADTVDLVGPGAPKPKASLAALVLPLDAARKR